MRWVWHVAFMGEMGIFYKSFSQETWRKRPFGRPTSRWEDNIKCIWRKYCV